MALGLKKKTPPPKARSSTVEQRPLKAKAEGATPSVPATRPHKFTARQEQFIDQYLICHNASEASRRAGYAPKDANVTGSQLLANPNISAEIERRKAILHQKAEVTAERVIAELAKIAFANMADYMRPQGDGSAVLDFSALTRDQAAALGTITVEEFKDGRSDKREVRRTKFALWDKPKALELLGKRFKLFGDEPLPADPRQTLTLLSMMFREIDAADRGKTIEHKP